MYVGKIARYLDGVQVIIEQRVLRSDHVEKCRAPTGLKLPLRLSQAGMARGYPVAVALVARGEAGDHDIEAGIGERQPLRRRLLQRDIDEARLNRSGLDGGRHTGRDLASKDLLHQCAER